MAYSARWSRCSPTKPEAGDHLIMVVLLDDLTQAKDSLFVRIFFVPRGIQVVVCARGRWVAVGAGEVNSDLVTRKGILELLSNNPSNLLEEDWDL